MSFINEQTLLNDMFEFVGKKIKFKVYEGEFEGIVKHVNREFCRIKIDKVCILPSKECMGTLNFFADEFEYYNLLPDTIRSEEQAKSISKLNKSVKDAKKYSLSHLCYNSGSDFPSQCSDVEGPALPEKEEYVFLLPEKLEANLSTDIVLLQSIDREFENAVSCINRETVIGVSFEGPKIRRNGILSWIGISTPLCSFLFDIQSLKMNCFDKGLRNIFEDPLIEKVIHDCREPADCLHHMYHTKLVNVYDTQVADYLVNRLKTKAMNRFCVKPLNVCLHEYLQVPKLFLYEANLYTSYQDLVTAFMLRPISNEFHDFAVKNVIYLRLLKTELSKLLMQPFKQAVDIYLCSVSSCSELELQLEASMPDTIPYALLMERLNIIQVQSSLNPPEIVSSGAPFPWFCDPIKKMDSFFTSNKLQETGNKPDQVLNSELSSTANSSLKSINRSNILANKLIEAATEDNQLAEEISESNEDCDPWLKLREAFLPYYDNEYGRKNYSYIPSGME